MSYRSELIQVAAVAVCAVQEMDTGTTLLREESATEFEAGFEQLEWILDEVRRERYSQEAKWGTRSAVDPKEWLTILTEEVGEVARAILERDGV